ncbi:hypothetical protein [Rubrivivax gelatinosus]|uniref:Uncharacterized protein n=1 Tax=Rubrivivax gelatinosus TaxID=28068 RepID=A0ABS1DNH6_RUBGE|nr:hypothetical protein [Rubrivivax gelatinosus]MBK1711266.1 hypothetical protein [Rubrivivax gelatinosus]
MTTIRPITPLQQLHAAIRRVRRDIDEKTLLASVNGSKKHRYRVFHLCQEHRRLLDKLTSMTGARWVTR